MACDDRPFLRLLPTDGHTPTHVQYTLRCDLKRGAFSKDLAKTTEFIVESAQAALPKTRVPFKVRCR